VHLLGAEVGADRSRGVGVVHVAVDAGGTLVHGPSQLPLVRVTAAAPAGVEIVVGGLAGDGRPAAVGIAPDGTLRWSAQVPPAAPGDAPVVLPPEVVDDGGRALLVYATGTAGTGPTRVRLVAAGPGGCIEVGAVDLDGAADGLAVAATPSGVTIAGAGRAPDRLELVRVVDGRVEDRRRLADRRAVAPALAPLLARLPAAPPAAAGILAAWVAPDARELRAQPLGADLAPLAPAAPIVTGSAAGRPSSVRLLCGPVGPVAVAWQLTRRDHRNRVRVEQSVALYDPAGGLGEPVPLAGGGPYAGGGWVDGTLAVVHGSDAPLLSTFRAEDPGAT